MCKYIDSEKLIAEIERRLEKYDPDYTNAGSELKELLSFVTSLQQEQPEFVNEIWHKVSEEANLTRPVVLSDGDKYMSPPSTFPFKDMSGFVNAMNKKYKADYTIWAYMDDLLNISSIQQEQPEVDTLAILPEDRMASYIKYCLERDDDECQCPSCDKHVTGLRLFPYFYDKANNDVYFATVCPECNNIIISKE